MASVRAVIEYTGLDLRAALELPCDMFALCVKNRTIERLQQTEEGRQYLADCERYKKTKMDVNALKEAF